MCVRVCMCGALPLLLATNSEVEAVVSRQTGNDCEGKRTVTQRQKKGVLVFGLWGCNNERNG